MTSSPKKKCNLQEACEALTADLINYKHVDAHARFCYEIFSFDEEDFLTKALGLKRMVFKSRDRDFAIFGLGAADIIKTDSSDDNTAYKQLVDKVRMLNVDQFYFGAMRFDEQHAVADEWHHFGKKIFILPLMMVVKHEGVVTLSLNYRSDGCLSFAAWLDHAFSLLKTMASETKKKNLSIEFENGSFTPTKHEYCKNIGIALSFLLKNAKQTKVVMGRRRSIYIKNAVDPVNFFLRLESTSKNAFLFFFDNGQSSAFFGGSPELLYRRSDLRFETESLAGTRPRSRNSIHDQVLRDALLQSLKDHREHSLVSLYIEEKLKSFSITDLCVSELQIMILPFVQHLVKRYHGTINTLINDADILSGLHPTPAVCGSEILWAKQFVREHEGFDRGLYAGPIGYLGQREAEFAVAIRSALYYEQQLYIYAASGIVEGADPGQEWEELNNKEKTILSIFD